MEITFSAFLSLRAKLDGAGVPCRQARLEAPDGCTVGGLIAQVGLDDTDVEAVFVNGRVMPMDTPLTERDRVAFVPPGTPGPHRCLLGIARSVEQT